MRDAVAPALAGATVSVGWLPVSPPPPPHPVKNGIIVSRRFAAMAVRHSGMQAASVTLVRGKKDCCLVKSLMCCSRETGGYGYVDLGLVYVVRDSGQEVENLFKA